MKPVLNDRPHLARRASVYADFVQLNDLEKIGATHAQSVEYTRDYRGVEAKY